MNKLYEKVKKLRVVNITWLDATEDKLTEKEFLESSFRELLMERVTPGFLYKNTTMWQKRRAISYMNHVKISKISPNFDRK